MPDFTPLSPNIVLGVVAHPDDLEFGVAGTVAKYIKQGAQVYYYVLTNGNKGSDDPAETPDHLRDKRRDEQRTAAQILGVSDVFFSDYEDGCLECCTEAKCDVARVIRRVKPDVVITFDPTSVYSAEMGIINHTDHRAAGQATLDACYPLARDRLSFPQLLEEGLEPHKVRTVLMVNFDEANYYEDVTDTFSIKMEALQAHGSQLPDFDSAKEMLTRIAKKHGVASGCDLAESFVRLDLPT